MKKNIKNMHYCNAANVLAELIFHASHAMQWNVDFIVAVCLSVCMSVCVYVCLSVCVRVCV